MAVSNYDPDDDLPRLRAEHEHGDDAAIAKQFNDDCRPFLLDYDDIIDGDTIAVDLQLLDNLAAAVDAYDNDDDMPRVRTALAVFTAARALIADTAGNPVTP